MYIQNQMIKYHICDIQQKNTSEEVLLPIRVKSPVGASTSAVTLHILSHYVCFVNTFGHCVCIKDTILVQFAQKIDFFCHKQSPAKNPQIFKCIQFVTK